MDIQVVRMIDEELEHINKIQADSTPKSVIEQIVYESKRQTLEQLKQRLYKECGPFHWNQYDTNSESCQYDGYAKKEDIFFCEYKRSK